MTPIPDLAFPIVGLVTTLSLILTFLYNKKPIHDFKLEAKNFLFFFPAKKILIPSYCLSFLLILSPYLSHLCKEFRILGSSKYDDYFILANEIGALLLFIAIFDTVLISFFTLPKYSKYNLKRFFGASCDIVLHGSEDDLASFGRGIKFSFQEIIKSAGLYNKHEAHRKEKENKIYYVSEVTSCSLDLLDILSDSRFCKILVTRCSSSFFYLVNTIQKNSLYNGGGYSFVRNLFKKAFLLEDSILHREKDFDGYGHQKSFTKLVFSNSRFLRSFNIFSNFPSYYDDQLRAWQVKKFTDCLKVSLKSPEKIHDWRYLLDAFKTLEGWVSGSTFSINKSKNLDWRSEPSLILQECSDSLCKVLDILRKNSDKFPDFEDTTNFDEIRYENPYMIIAEGIHNFLSTISSKDSDDEFYRSYSIKIWLALFNHDKNNKSLVAVAKCLEYLLYENDLRGIEQSFVKGYYGGLTLRAILTISFPYAKPEQINSDEELIEDRILHKAYQILREHFVTKYNENPDFALSYLPKQIEYDRDNKILKEKNWDGGYKIFSLVDNDMSAV